MYPVAGSPLSQARLVGSILERPNRGIAIARPITTDAPTHLSRQISRVKSGAAREVMTVVYSCSSRAMGQGIKTVPQPAMKMQRSRQRALRLWSLRSAGVNYQMRHDVRKDAHQTCLAQLLRRAHGLRAPLRGVGRSLRRHGRVVRR